MSGIDPLDESERQRLKQLARRAVGRVSERIRMVLLSSRGYSIAQIAAIFECDEATVRHWLARNAEFRRDYADARQMQMMRLGDEMLEIAYECSDLRLARRRIGALNLVAARLTPKKYGKR